MKRVLVVMGVSLVLALGLALGYRWGQKAATSIDAPAAAAAATTGPERRVLYWYDPMAPQQHFDQPGRSPFMDMALIPRYADEVAGGVDIAPGLQQRLGLRTARAERAAVAEEIRASGALQWDQSAERRVSARVEGLVERVHVRTPFAAVKRGEPLATLLAPALAGALAEYRALANGSSPQTRALAAAARTRLQLLGLSAADIGSAADGPLRIVLRAPADGVAAEIAVRDGETVTPGQLLFRLESATSVWLEARVPQNQAAALQRGNAASITIAGEPAPRTATIDAVLPEVDAATRTRRVRLVLANADGRLAAGQFAEVRLQGAAAEDSVWLPSEALIADGAEARVILRDEAGRFRPLRVRVGRVVGTRTQILDGLAGGEEVVVSGQFLIDSEASLAGLLTRLDAESAAPAESPPAHHPHGEQP